LTENIARGSDHGHVVTVQGNRVNNACGSENPLEWFACGQKHAIRHCEERSDEAIRAKYIMNTPWIALPASEDAGSQ